MFLRQGCDAFRPTSALAKVRFGSEAVVCASAEEVRFRGLSGPNAYVCFVPEADLLTMRSALYPAVQQGPSDFPGPLALRAATHMGRDDAGAKDSIEREPP